MSHHPVVDLDHWLSVFPIEKLKDEQETEFSQHPAWKGKSRNDLQRLTCPIINSPIDLALLEQLREPVIEAHNIKEAVPVDVFLWRQSPSDPWLTKIGGIPFRPHDRPWPTDPKTGQPYVFVAQFCFLDSFDVLPLKIPGDLLLIYFKDSDGVYAPDDGLCLEWVTIGDCKPMLSQEAPTPPFVVPNLAGVRYRGYEFPDHYDEFCQVDCKSAYLLPVSQGTRIGTESFFIQQYPDVPDGSILIATLSFIYLTGRWPLIDVEGLPPQHDASNRSSNWGEYRMMLDDAGCVYIFLDNSGRTHWRFDCY
jgi:hypothetical protein